MCLLPSQQRAGSSAGFVGERVTRKHPRNFINAHQVRQGGDGGQGHITFDPFTDLPVMRATGGDLRRMGDNQHLTIVGERGQAATDRVRGGSANTPVDFIEDQRQAGDTARETDLHGQQKTAEFPTRGNAVQRTCSGAGVRGDGKGDGVHAIGAGISRSDVNLEHGAV